MSEFDDFWDDEPQDNNDLITLEELQAMPFLAYDLQEGPRGRLFQSAFAEMCSGTKLKNAGPLIVGTTSLWPPVKPVRVLVFSNNVHMAPDSIEDAWELGCIDGNALYTVADTYDYLKVHQITIVEVERSRLAEHDKVTLDDSAKKYVHNLLEGSFGGITPTYAFGHTFQELMGNSEFSEPETRFLTCDASDLKSHAEEVEEADGAEDTWHDAIMAEAELDTTPEYQTIVEPETGARRIRALKGRQDGHPALAYLEAAKNAEVLYKKLYDELLMTRLYSGDKTPVTDYEKDLLRERVWFGSVIDAATHPVESADVDEYLDEMRDAYDYAAEQAPGAVISRGAFDRLSEWYRRRAEGDIDACAREISDAALQVAVPYRLEFSASFDYERKSAKLNVFVPSRALFPLQASNAALANAENYQSLMLDESEFNSRHSELSCRMGIAISRIVKSKAPWIKHMQVNGLYRGSADDQQFTRDISPRCLYSFEVEEKDMDPHIFESSGDVFQVMHDLHARLHRSRSRMLVPVEPIFDPEEALDYKFGFKYFRDRWTVPYPCKPYSEKGDAEDLAYLTARVEDYLDRGELERAHKLCVEVADTYTRSWVDVLPETMRPVSCNSAFETKFAKELLKDDTRELAVLPNGLSHFYVVYANVCFEMDNLGDAADLLVRARDLNPAFPEPMFGQIGMALDAKDFDAAERYAGDAFEVAYLARDMAQVYRVWATIAMHRNEYDLATSLYNFALGVSQDRDTVEQAMRDLAFLRAAAGQNTEAEEDPVSTLIFNGYPIHASEKIFNVCREEVENALDGGPLPDGSVLAAYINSRNTTEPLSEELQLLMLNVMGDAFETTPMDRYLNQPVIIDSVAVGDMLGNESGLLDEDDDDSELAIMVIPYIDGNGDLRFYVVGTVGRHSREVLSSKRISENLELSTAGFSLEHFTLVRPDDYPDLDLEERCSLLADVYRPSASCEETRSIRGIDHLRNFERPDDVMVVLRWAGLTPEGAWVHLDYVNEGHQLVGTLMTEPYDDFKIHLGDTVVLRIVRDWQVSGGIVAFVEPPEPER